MNDKLEIKFEKSLFYNLLQTIYNHKIIGKIRNLNEPIFDNFNQSDFYDWFVKSTNKKKEINFKIEYQTAKSILKFLNSKDIQIKDIDLLGKIIAILDKEIKNYEHILNCKNSK